MSPPTEDHPQQGGPAHTGTRTEALRARLEERTADLQRVKAEYDNYRKRVRRDRLAVREIAVANVLTGLLPVLDAIDAGRGHGEVTGGFQLVVEALERQLSVLGLESFGREGDLFDPAVHEAVSRIRSDPGGGRTVCAGIHRTGYRVGGQLLRPAQVTVAQPPAEPPAARDTGADARTDAGADVSTDVGTNTGTRTAADRLPRLLRD
jgi:molecular chaperone GrpE